MIKKYINKIAMSIMVGVMSTSCLNYEPESQLADTNVWESSSNFVLFANHFYNDLIAFVEILNVAYIHADVGSDIVVPGVGVSTNTLCIGEYTVPNTDTRYSGGYDMIYDYNLLLSKAEEYGGSISDIAVPIGEARFFRAYAYYELLQIYGGVPLITKCLDLDSPELTATQNTRTEIVDQMIEDLQYVVDNKLLGNEGSSESGRITMGAVQGFLSRIALYEGSWQKYHEEDDERAEYLFDIAATAAKAVIDSKVYSLYYNSGQTDKANYKSMEAGALSYKYLFTLEDQQTSPVSSAMKSSQSEYIIYRQYDTVLKQVGTNVTHGARGTAVAKKFADMFLDADGLPIDNANSCFEGYNPIGTEFNNRDNRMFNILQQPGTTYWDNESTTCRIDWSSDATEVAHGITQSLQRCYTSQKWATERQLDDTDEGYDLPILRYAEVLLNYAEAVYERDGAISDEDLDISLNLTRLRVNKNMPSLSNAFVSENGLDMMEEIRRERCIEMYHEALRMDDLKRWKEAENAIPETVLGMNYTYGSAYSFNGSTGFNDGDPIATWTDTTTGETWQVIQKGSDGKNYGNDAGSTIRRSFDEKYYLMPFPTNELLLNPNLVQNPGW